VSPGNCTFTSVVDGVTLTTIDGELQPMAPLEVCDADEVDATNSDLCEDPEALTQAALIANAWLMQNLFLDGLLGYEVPLFGVIVVEDGVVTSFTPTPPPGDETPAVPVVLDPALDVTENDSPFGGTGPQTEIITDEENSVVFTIQTGGATYIVFTELFEEDPNPVGPGALNGESSFGTLSWSADGTPESWQGVVVMDQYLSSYFFMFEPGEVVAPFSVGGVGAQGEIEEPFSQTGDFAFYVETAGGVQSAPETVDVTVYDVPYECEFEGGSTASATTDDAPPASEETEQTPADPAE
jgi:hypothetical protein